MTFLRCIKISISRLEIPIFLIFFLITIIISLPLINSEPLTNPFGYAKNPSLFGEIFLSPFIINDYVADRGSIIHPFNFLTYFHAISWILNINVISIGIPILLFFGYLFSFWLFKTVISITQKNSNDLPILLSAFVASSIYMGGFQAYLILSELDIHFLFYHSVAPLIILTLIKGLNHNEIKYFFASSIFLTFVLFNTPRMAFVILLITFMIVIIYLLIGTKQSIKHNRIYPSQNPTTNSILIYVHLIQNRFLKIQKKLFATRKGSLFLKFVLAFSCILIFNPFLVLNYALPVVSESVTITPVLEETLSTRYILERHLSLIGLFHFQAPQYSSTLSTFLGLPENILLPFFYFSVILAILSLLEKKNYNNPFFISFSIIFFISTSLFFFQELFRGLLFEVPITLINYSLSNPRTLLLVISISTGILTSFGILTLLTRISFIFSYFRKV